MLARDHTGEMIEAISSCRQENIDPEMAMAEAIDTREALSWGMPPGSFSCIA